MKGKLTLIPLLKREEKTIMKEKTMNTNKRIQTVFLGRLLRIVAVVAIAAAAIPQVAPQISVNAAPAVVEALESVDVAPTSPQLTAVDPLAWAMFGDVIPARPFLYSVDEVGITITRFNDNQVVGTWPWPTDVIYTVLPDGSFTGLVPPAVWEPVGMTVSYPTETEIANRVKEIPDLTPPWTFVYVVMAHSGYQWQSSSGHRDTLVPSTDPDQRVGAAPPDQRERPLVLVEKRLCRSGGSAHRGRDPRPRRGPAGLRPLDRKCLCRQHAVQFSAHGPHFVRVRDRSNFP